MHGWCIVAMREAKLDGQAAPIARDHQVFALTLQLPVHAAANSSQVVRRCLEARERGVASRGVQHDADDGDQAGNNNGYENG